VGRSWIHCLVQASELGGCKGNPNLPR
jgi:hypothetical protein